MRQLELLAALEHVPTLSAAAREAGLSQPAASKLLGALSDDLAIDLFEKAGRSLRPTAAGRALIRHAANLIGNLDRAQAEIEAIESGLSGTVAVGAGIGACYVLMPRALSLLLDQAPDVVVTMREGAMEEHFAMLRDGRLDLVIGRVEPALVDRDFAMDELYDPAIHHRRRSAASARACSVRRSGPNSPSRTGSCRRKARRCAPASSVSSGA